MHFERGLLEGKYKLGVSHHKLRYPRYHQMFNLLFRLSLFVCKEMG